MFAIIVNVITVIVGSTVGLLCKKGIPKRLSDAVMLGIGLCTLYIGIDKDGSTVGVSDVDDCMLRLKDLK